MPSAGSVHICAGGVAEPVGRLNEEPPPFEEPPRPPPEGRRRPDPWCERDVREWVETGVGRTNLRDVARRTVRPAR